ncbi:phosphodiester glycosidase family protein [Streptomyces sp. NPDC127069]|uniref:phosphodiester glycosidase family protein n=1 Tax=Streptomyces sp. NPDC127069 TaxID=3347128 RepID=UPI00366692CF
MSLRPLLPALLSTLLLAPAPAYAAAGGPDDGIETARTTRQLAPGIRLESYDRLEADRWLRIDELVADLDPRTGVRAEYLGTGGGPVTLPEAAARYRPGPGRRVIAAVNGDFFDIRATGAPLGPGVGSGRLLHSASPGPGGGAAVGFGPDGAGRLLRLGLDGTVTLPGGRVHPLAGYNAAKPPAEGFAVYTADWGGKRLPALGPGPAVELRDGRVVSAGPAPVARPAPGTTLLTARGTGPAAALAALRPGDEVAVAARPLPASGPAPVTALGGRGTLVAAGSPLNHDGEGNNTAAPRTAVGLSRDGRRLSLVTVDGRQRDSGGLTLTALGALMRRLGAYEALNLDGGGSATLLAAHPGAGALTLENSPSDGQPRPVPNGLVLTAPAGPGPLAGFDVEPAGGATRLFPGLTRTLTATPYDATLAPAAAAPRWSTDRGRIGQDGVYRADRPGPAVVRVAAGPGAPGKRPAGASGGAAVPGGEHAAAAMGPGAGDGTGQGPAGASGGAAPGVAGGPLAGPPVRAAAGAGGGPEGVLRLEVLGPLAGLRAGPGRIGLERRGESAGFVLTGYDAQGATAPVEPRDLTLDYDRSRWRVTEDGRGGFTVTALVPQASGRLTATVKTTGATAGLALGVGSVAAPLAGFEDAAAWTGPGAAPAEGHPGPGLALEARADAAAAPPRPLPVPELTRALSLWVGGDGSGARPAVELAGADGVPLTLRGPAVDWTGWREVRLPVPATAEQPLRVTRLSAAPGARPGRLLLDTLTATTPPTGPAAPGTARPDPVVGTAAQAAARPWRFAVGGAPAGGGAELVLTGTERAPFLHRGVRFVPLDTGRRTLDRGAGLARMRALGQALEAAAREPGTAALAVVLPYAPDTLDRKETALLALRLAEFRRTTGKKAAVLTVGAPRFTAGRQEGVLTVAAPRTGRTLFGADAFAAPGRDWLSVAPPQP